MNHDHVGFYGLEDVKPYVIMANTIRAVLLAARYNGIKRYMSGRIPPFVLGEGPWREAYAARAGRRDAADWGGGVTSEG